MNHRDILLHHFNIKQLYIRIPVHIRKPYSQLIIPRCKSSCQNLLRGAAKIRNLFQCFHLVIAESSFDFLIKGQLYRNRIISHKLFIISAEGGYVLLILCRKHRYHSGILLYFYAHQLYDTASIHIGNSDPQAVIPRYYRNRKGLSGILPLHSGPLRPVVIHICLYLLIKGQSHLRLFTRLEFFIIFRKTGVPSSPFTAEYLHCPAQPVKHSGLSADNGKLRKLAAGKGNRIRISIQILQISELALMLSHHGKIIALIFQLIRNRNLKAYGFIRGGNSCLFSSFYLIYRDIGNLGHLNILSLFSKQFPDLPGRFFRQCSVFYYEIHLHSPVNLFIAQDGRRRFLLCRCQDPCTAASCDRHIVIEIRLSGNLYLDIHDLCKTAHLRKLPQLDTHVIVIRPFRPADGLGIHIVSAMPYAAQVKSNRSRQFFIKGCRNRHGIPHLIIRMPFTELGTKSTPGARQYRNRLLLQFGIIGNYPYRFDHHGAVAGTNLNICYLFGYQIIRQKVLDILIGEYSLFDFAFFRPL